MGALFLVDPKEAADVGGFISRTCVSLKVSACYTAVKGESHTGNEVLPRYLLGSFSFTPSEPKLQFWNRVSMCMASTAASMTHK